MDDKKDNLAVLIAMKAKKKGMKGDESKYTDMAEDLLEDIEKGDPEAVASCLKDFVEACVADLEKGGDEDENSEEEAY